MLEHIYLLSSLRGSTIQFFFSVMDSFDSNIMVICKHFERNGQGLGTDEGMCALTCTSGCGGL